MLLAENKARMRLQDQTLPHAGGVQIPQAANRNSTRTVATWRARIPRAAALDATCRKLLRMLLVPLQDAALLLLAVTPLAVLLVAQQASSCSSAY